MHRGAKGYKLFRAPLCLSVDILYVGVFHIGSRRSIVCGGVEAEGGQGGQYLHGLDADTNDALDKADDVPGIVAARNATAAGQAVQMVVPPARCKILLLRLPVRGRLLRE